MRRAKITQEGNTKTGEIIGGIQAKVRIEFGNRQKSERIGPIQEIGGNLGEERDPIPEIGGNLGEERDPIPEIGGNLGGVKSKRKRGNRKLQNLRMTDLPEERSPGFQEEWAQVRAPPTLKT